jgi:hypothetical protein
MRWSRLFTAACAWFALSGVAFAQEQLSIRCMTVEPDAAQRDRSTRRSGGTCRVLTNSQLPNSQLPNSQRSR